MFTNVALRMGRTQPRRTDANMWLISGVLCDNTCRRLKTSSKGQQRYQDRTCLLPGYIMKSADVKQTKITVSVEEKFSRTVLHQLLSLDTDTSSFACEWEDMTANRQMVSPVLRYFFPQSPEPMLLNFK